ncbi:MAG: hypothetical protein ABI237_06030 [Ginsengibacter sp.]
MQHLTLTQQSTMAGSITLQKRLVAAVKTAASYWKGFPLNTLQSYNVANQKRKLFATMVLNGSVPNIQAYAEYLLNNYQFATGAESGQGIDLDSNDEVSDAVLSDSTASAASYDFFAGVQPGDDSKQVTF